MYRIITEIYIKVINYYYYYKVVSLKIKSQITRISE